VTPTVCGATPKPVMFNVLGQPGGIHGEIERLSKSETVFQSNLHLAHRLGHRDNTESGWCLRIGRWFVPVRVIIQVERL
jgi:hypothetical protein